MASSSEVDAWIATLRKCEIIDENSVKKLCQMAVEIFCLLYTSDAADE